MGQPTGSGHARMVACSWEGERVEAIAQALHCSPQTVRRRLHRFDEEEGLEGMGDRSKPGRPRRFTSEDDSRLIALVNQAPPGRLVTQQDGSMVARDEEADGAMEPQRIGSGGQRGWYRGQTLADPHHPLARGRAASVTPTVGARLATRMCVRNRTAVVSPPLHRAARGVDEFF